jgi:hypothetical protein
MRGTILKRGNRYSVVLELNRDPVTGKRRREWHLRCEQASTRRSSRNGSATPP